ncbi:Trigger factor [Macleaya cordata]|uniref:peptidylprolyl isomerase n=1 Tax=Macleaya cordata TaxID=56857 RepID=A0A200RBE3_MACCD|nr:Trigger factor [Macleaya cordata]
MELLSSSTALNFKPSLSHHFHLSTSSIHFSNSNPLLQPNYKPTNFPKLTSSSRQFHLSQSSTRKLPSQLAVSASAVSLDAEKDKLPADIEVTEIQEPGSRVRLSVNVPPVVCEDCYQRVLAEITKKAKVPGFRPGKKVPESILIHHVGKSFVRKATIESILRRTLPHAMSSVTGRALKDSVRITTKFSDMDESFSFPHDYLRYDAVVDVAPEIKWVPEKGYANLKIVVEIDNDIDAQIACEAEIKRRHKALGSLRIVTDRGLQVVGDVAVLNISTTKVTKDDDVERIPSAESKGFQLDTEEADNLPPGFLDSIIGIQGGETKSFPLVFPESWKQENLRGVHAQFTVECKELFYRDLPVLDDSLAERLLPGCSTLAEVVKESILQRCKEIEQTAKEQATDNAILDQLCKMIEVDIPRSLFEEQGRQLYGAKLLQIQANMKLDEQQLASLSSPKAVNEYLEYERENITHLVKQNLAVGDIFKRENLQFSTEELVKEVENSIAEFKRNNQEYDEERVKDQVQEILEGAKVLEWLREHATIEYVTK